MKRFFQRGMVAMGAVAALTLCVGPAFARIQPGDPEYQDIQALEQELLQRAQANPASIGKPGAQPAATPDIFGPGSVLNVGNVVMKVTNYAGLVGNPFTNVSSDPSGQWPGASAIEYLNYISLVVGAVNPLATDPNAVRRVSYLTEWRPASLDPEDKIYRSYDGIVNGTRFVNDDGDRDPLTGDPLIDEDFLDGRDNDGDGKIDEDYAAIGQQMYTCVIRDDTPQAINAAAAERHVPLGLEAHQSAWAYSIPGFTDFNVVQWDIFNRSGHQLDSVLVGIRCDMDCGPLEKANYYADDFDLPKYPFGNFMIVTPPTDKRLQPKGDYPSSVADVSPDSALCPRYMVTVNGFSVADDDGDDGKTIGVPTVMLLDHTIDPTGQNGPIKVGWSAFRSFPGGTPYAQGGNPTIDQQRFEFMSSHENVHSDPGDDPKLKGFISLTPGDQKGDYSEWAAIPPFLHLANGAMVSLTVAFGVQRGDYRTALQYELDYLRKAELVKSADPRTGDPVYAVTDGGDLLAKYPSLDNALAAQVAFEGSYEDRPTWPQLTDYPGRETPIKAPRGQTLQVVNTTCEVRQPAPVTVNDRQYSWFDFDCDYCTGAYSVQAGHGMFHHTWLAESPPPNPATNLAVNFNYADNPDRYSSDPSRNLAPAGDGQVLIAWDNISENTPDPKTGWFDFRGYKVWKVSNWTRPVGSGGPSEDDWTLLAEYRLFDGAPNNRILCDPAVDPTCGAVGDTVCPLVYIPQLGHAERVCLNRGDLWNLQSGDVIHPFPVPCVPGPTGDCLTDSAFALGTRERVGRTRYPVGRYRYVDRQVKDGFMYFYSVTAFDSTGQGDGKVELNGRRSASEAEGVVPQSSTVAAGKGVWVVPNPYRGLKNIQARPSAWDLTPNASDPTGTHVDFFGLPAGKWSIKIFTISGDLVQTIHSDDPVNDAVRNGTVTDNEGHTHSSFNRQQDTPTDGQARWNLISRNGQDVVSGIYLFTVESSRGTQRGKFVIIR